MRDNDEPGERGPMNRHQSAHDARRRDATRRASQKGTRADALTRLGVGHGGELETEFELEFGVASCRVASWPVAP